MRIGMSGPAKALLGLFAIGLYCHPARAEDWIAATPEELRMTDEPKAPKAAAIFLYRQVDRDDRLSYEAQYIRIKILSEEGRRFGDVEIVFDKANERIRGIEARTIHPDGAIVKFDGTIYEKTIAKAKGVKWFAKTFTLPDVQVGSIIEYRYERLQQTNLLFNSHWILSDELYTRYAKFSLLPYEGYTLRYSWPVGLPPGTDKPKEISRRIRLETRDVPAFVTEEYMPPENELKYRVDFIYLDPDADRDQEPIAFWKNVGKRANKDVERFVDQRTVMQQAVGEIVAAGDPPLEKLKKIYARTQQIRNTSFARTRTAQEAARDEQKEPKNVADVWTRGYGNGAQITWLFLALARAAGLQADPLMVPTRDAYFFDQRIMNPGQLNTNIVAVQVDGGELFLDPGTAFAPFGLLPWPETGVVCRRLNKDGGAWVTSPLPPASESRIEHKASLRLSASGALEGTVTVTYTGLEALRRRITERNEDDAERTAFLENELKADIPTGIEAKLTNTPVWEQSEPPLVAVFDVEMPGWASAAGQRLLMSVGLFGGGEASAFQHTVRVHPVYYDFPHESVDDVTIELPAGWRATSLPQEHVVDRTALIFKSSAASNGSQIHLERDFAVKALMVSAAQYGAVQRFYEAVRAADQDQLVLSAAAAKRAQ